MTQGGSASQSEISLPVKTNNSNDITPCHKERDSASFFLLSFLFISTCFLFINLSFLRAKKGSEKGNESRRYHAFHIVACSLAKPLFHQIARYLLQ